MLIRPLHWPFVHIPPAMEFSSGPFSHKHDARPCRCVPKPVARSSIFPSGQMPLCRDQTLRVWLISKVASRRNEDAASILGSSSSRWRPGILTFGEALAKDQVSKHAGTKTLSCKITKNLAVRPERLKKYCSHVERGFLIFWRGLSEGACPKRPVTERK